MLPEDVIRWLSVNVPADEQSKWTDLISSAVLHDGSRPGDRLYRCLAVGSRGKYDLLEQLVGYLKLDYRDVIVFGEYDNIEGKIVKVRDLMVPI